MLQVDARLRVVVLISGSGTNARALIEACADARFPVTIVAVGADREAAGLEFAASVGIPTFVEPYPIGANRGAEHREAWGDAVLRDLDAWSPDVVVLSGFMRILPPHVVAAWQGRLINTHPARLPAFPGAHAVRDALAAGVEQTGATVHLVDAGVDTGPILAQTTVAVEASDTEATLHERIKVEERVLLRNVLRDIATGDLVLPEQHRAECGATPVQMPAENDYKGTLTNS